MYLVFSYLLPTTAQLSIILQGLPSSKTVTISGYITTHLKDLLMPLGIFHEAEVVGAAFLCPTRHFRYDSPKGQGTNSRIISMVFGPLKLGRRHWSRLSTTSRHIMHFGCIFNWPLHNIFSGSPHYVREDHFFIKGRPGRLEAILHASSMFVPFRCSIHVSTSPTTTYRSHLTAARRRKPHLIHTSRKPVRQPSVSWKLRVSVLVSSGRIAHAGWGGY